MSKINRKKEPFYPIYVLYLQKNKVPPQGNRKKGML